MKALMAILWVAVSVQAQSLADLARHERERQSHLKPAQVITGTGTGASVPAGRPAQKTEESKKTAVDPVKEYNDQIEKLRSKIRSLQDEETATQLQINELNNQVYAAIVDQAAKDESLAVVGAAQMKLADIRKELTDTRKTLEAMETQGPPKK
jgi:TolA-binding protein